MNLGNYEIVARNVLVFPALNHRVTSFAATKNDDLLATAMSESETTPGSGVYGWGINFRVKALNLNDSLLVDGKTIAGVTEVDSLKMMYMDRMAKRHEQFKADASADGLRDDARKRADGILDAFESMYCVDGVLVEPDWDESVVLIEGHHRKLGHTLELASFLCSTAVGADGVVEPKPFTDLIPVSVVTYKLLSQLRLDQYKGNGIAQVHNPLAELDLIQMAVDQIPAGMLETQFRKLGGEDSGSTGRRAYGIAKLHCYYPELDIMGHLTRYVEGVNGLEASGMKPAEAKTAMFTTRQDVVPLEAFSNNANDPASNVPGVLRVSDRTNTLSDLQKAMTRKGANSSPWEVEASSTGKMWDLDRVKTWFKTRIPALNGGKLIVVENKKTKADSDYINGPIRQGILSSIGARYADIVMTATDERLENSNFAFLQLNTEALNAVDSLLSSPAAGAFRLFVTDLAVLIGVSVDGSKTVIEDARSAIVQIANRASEEAASAEVTVTDTAGVGEVPPAGVATNDAVEQEAEVGGTKSRRKAK